uniref:F-box domain-containing protein n=1 Tax=Strongyloides papillosus TaxID=174720 RepID=A0A0N5CGT9_STREA
MDLNNLGMNFSIEEEYFEEKDYISDLPDDVLAIIFSNLSWKDILCARIVSRGFYNVINKNYHKLERRKVEDLWINYKKNSDSHPIHVKMSFYSGDFRDVPMASNTKKTDIQDDQELLRFLKIFDMKNLGYLEVYGSCDPCIFDILNRSLPIGTNIGELFIFKLEEKSFNSFRLFVEKHSSIENLSIVNIYSSSKGVEDIYSRLSLSSLRSMKAFTNFYTAGKEVLLTDLVIKLLRMNPNIEYLNIGETNNIEFVKSILKKYFTMEQPHKMQNECGYNETTLYIKFNGMFYFLLLILREELKELGNVGECIYERGICSVFISILNCKYCLKNKHIITRRVVLWDEGEELDR